MGKGLSHVIVCPIHILVFLLMSISMAVKRMGGEIELHTLVSTLYNQFKMRCCTAAMVGSEAVSNLDAP